jgi:serine/threonine-protein kinase
MRLMPDDSSEDLSFGAEREIDQICDNFEDRLLAGERPRVEDYLDQRPEPAWKELLYQLVRLDIDYRRRGGEVPTLADYLPHWPAQADLLEKVLAELPGAAGPDLPSGERLTDPQRLSTSPASPTPSDLEPGDLPAGTLLGKYEIVEMIGRGGMGFVYRAFNPDLKCHVALKVIRSGELAHPDEIRRFELECQALVRFRHPHIVAVYDAGQHQGQPFLVMEYLGGGSLSDQLARFQNDPRSAVTLMEKVARAVQVLHAEDVLHRDLKPGNVLLDEAGQPRVSDFGLVKLLEGGDELTQTGQRPGTPAYMAPEQTGQVGGPLGPPTDVWALGVMLYELLLGRRPFRDREWASLFHQIARQQPDLPSVVQPGFDPELEAVLLRCLDKNPARRFATARELADELARWLGGERTQTRPPGLLRRLVRAGRRRPRLMALVALGLLALVVALVWYVFDTDRPLHDIQRTVGGGQEIELIGDTGGPRWSRWFVNQTANSIVDYDGYFTVDAMQEGAMLELARDLPVPAYRVRARVRHNKTLERGFIGIYVGGRSTRGPGREGHLFFALRYNGIFDHARAFAQVIEKEKPALKGQMKIPPKNPVALRAFLLLRADQAAPWPADFGGTGGVGVKPTGRAADQWRDLEIVVRPDSLQAAFDGEPLRPLELARLDPSLQSQLTAVIAADASQRGFLQALPARFDPQGSLGLYVSEGSASFANLVVTPIQ